MGGKPSKGTSKDMRLAVNRQPSRRSGGGMPAQPAAQTPKKPRRPRNG